MIAHSDTHDEYTVIHGNTAVRCTSIAQVVEVVRHLEREVPVATPVAETPASPRITVEDIDVRTATQQLFAGDRKWRRPIEIVKALRKLGVPRGDATYNKVYATLRYGPFVYNDGRWNLKDGAR